MYLGRLFFIAPRNVLGFAKVVGGLGVHKTLPREGERLKAAVTNGAGIPIPLISPWCQATKVQWSSPATPGSRPGGRALRAWNPMVVGREPHGLLVSVCTSSSYSLVSAHTDPLLMEEIGAHRCGVADIRATEGFHSPLLPLVGRVEVLLGIRQQ